MEEGEVVEVAVEEVRNLKLLQKSSNKLRMKALVGWNTLYKVPKLINLRVFFTRTKNDIDKEGLN